MLDNLNGRMKEKWLPYIKKATELQIYNICSRNLSTILKLSSVSDYVFIFCDIIIA